MKPSLPQVSSDASLEYLCGCSLKLLFVQDWFGVARVLLIEFTYFLD